MSMRIFVGGQIREKYRQKEGKLAVVVNKQELPKKAFFLEAEYVYGVFAYPVDSEEFVQLTGTRAVTSPIERIYIGVTPKVGDELARVLNNSPLNETRLKSLDGDMIYPQFIGSCVEPQERIVLQRTSEGYREVKERE